MTGEYTWISAKVFLDYGTSIGMEKEAIPAKVCATSTHLLFLSYHFFLGPQLILCHEYMA